MAADAAPPLPPDEGLDRRRLAVVSAQATSLRWQIVATAVVIALMVWPFVPAAVVIAWLALVVGVREVCARGSCARWSKTTRCPSRTSCRGSSPGMR
jgi:fatty acid desaturase